MTALNFFGSQLGVSPSTLIGDETPAWTRLEADVHLAAGRWQEAVVAFTDLLETPAIPVIRGELLRSRAEAHARLDNAPPAAADAAEAVRIFEAAGRESDAAFATYWLAYAQYKQDNLDEARSLMRGVLERVRRGLSVEPDFNLRLLLALSSIEAHDGEHAKALMYLQEVRGLADSLDDRRRATYLYDLAYAYRETGDTEAAIRTGLQSLALYRASGAEFEMAALENNLALAFLANGNIGRAVELVSAARTRFQQPPRRDVACARRGHRSAHRHGGRQARRCPPESGARDRHRPTDGQPPRARERARDPGERTPRRRPGR